MILCADCTDSNFLNYSANILDRFFSKYWKFSIFGVYYKL
jgi:hypothetical protein